MEAVEFVKIQPPSPDVIAMAAQLAQVPTNIVKASAAQLEQAIASPPAVAVTVLAVGQVIEWTKGRFAGATGHVMAIELDGVICVQQQCDLATLRWFKVPNGEFKIIGRAAGRYKIPDAEIQRQSERFKPKVKKMEDWDAPQ